MEDEGPSFVIYQDPEDEVHSSSTEEPSEVCIHHTARVVLGEIKLPSWGNDTNCDSGLKHEMLVYTSEPVPPSESDLTVSETSCEDSKENIISRSLRALSLNKTPPRKPSSSGHKAINLNRTPPAKFKFPNVPAIPPSMKHTPRTYTTLTITPSNSSVATPFRI